MRIKRTSYWNGTSEELKATNVKALLELKDLKAVVLINNNGSYTIYEKEAELDHVLESFASKHDQNRLKFSFDQGDNDER